MSTTAPDAPHGGVPVVADVHAALQPLLDRLEALVPPEHAPSALAFARAAYRRTPPERLAQLDLDAAAAQLAGAFRMVQARRPGELALRVYNPRRDELGWEVPGTAVDVVVEDGPFLLSTLTEELAHLGLEVVRTVHPVMGVERGDDGGLAAITPARGARNRESWMFLELAGAVAEERLGEIAERLRSVLGDAIATNRDFPAMRAAVAEIAFQARACAGSRYPREEVDEAVALLDWLLDDHFVLLGTREYDLVEVDGELAGRVHTGSGLGILSDESSSTWAQAVPLSQVDERLRERMTGGDLLVVARTNRESTVHRRERMLYVGVKKVEDGAIAGEYRILGLFAQKAHAEPASTIPVLRRKLTQILELEDVVDHSYDERQLRTLFEAFPKPELFQARVDELRRTLVALLEVAKRQDVRVLCSQGPDRRSTSVLVALPRGRFNANIRRQVRDLLAARFRPAGIDYHLSMSERDQALLHFVLHAPGDPDQPALAETVDPAALEREIRSLSRGWTDALRDALTHDVGAERGERLADAWAQRLPASYREAHSPAHAVGDVLVLEGLHAGEGVHLAFAPGDRPDRFRFKLAKAGPGVELSSFVPILESLGLVVVEEVPHTLEGQPEVHLHDFGVRLAPGAPGQPEGRADGERLAEAALAVWRGDAEADSLNQLVLAGLTWHDVALLRAYRRYRRQIGTSFTEAYQNEALIAHAGAARALVAYFRARFDPDLGADAATQEAARQAVLQACEAVQRLDQDRILRGFLGLVDATLRTNRYVHGRRQLALKLDSARVPDIPKPVPYAEIYVYSPRMEGVHLRGGPVARGGLRWSERQEDFRTEVLGLMKAQMVKNAVIVPTGSKGGFVLKRLPHDADVRQEVRRQYEVFIRGLLDLTDNVVEGEVRPPARVRRHDGDDPYLVVAADKGTASFSDVANAISEEYGFWLGDAFASGGSRGYDHKEMGITARGAWVAVERHFRELDIDVATEPVSVVGVGDMSGDVFGNGMLRSRAVRLIAAFDHRDIFIDPDPDAERAFEERRRLYELPRSSWQDYDADVISAGGGVWSRTVKEIPLSEQARAALRVEQERISPPDLIRAILRAPVDLLFFGGVGTFVKSSQETDAEVGDRANDAVRVDARDVAARVVGEGANLGFTQRGRVEFARRGGRINTDALDNVAGVDTSDHEVNLKILLRAAIDAGRIDVDERDALLGAMEPDVASAVLRDVYLQTGALSSELALGPGGVEPYEALMRRLVDSGRLDREVEALPSTDELERRAQAGAGLTRPELAVLIGYAKVDVSARLLDSAVPDQPALRAALESYFPPLAVERFGDLLDEHRLRRELVATVVANDVVNRMGVTWADRTAREFGAAVADVVAAYWVAREVAEAPEHWAGIEALDRHATAPLQLELKAEVDRLVDAYARAYLRQDATGDIAAAVRRDRPAFTQLRTSLPGMFLPPRRAAWRARVGHYVDLGIEPELAGRIVGLGLLALVPDVAAVSRAAGLPVETVAQLFVRLSERLPLDALHDRLGRVDPVGHWQRWQHRGLVDELRELRRATAERALAEAATAPAAGAELAERYLDERAEGMARVETLVRSLDREPDAGLDAVAVAVRLLRDVLLA